MQVRALPNLWGLKKQSHTNANIQAKYLFEKLQLDFFPRFRTIACHDSAKAVSFKYDFEQ